jgi:glycosyltransferase involved in cell wall biosynthesis
MGYPPNIESAYYAATQIMPLLQKKYPDIRLLIAGINAPERIKSLKSENIIIIEEWEFIRDAFAQSKIMLAPMLISIGLQNKILQAMAMKLPTIASSLANNAINAPENTAILIANTPGEYAAKITELLGNPLRMEQLATTAYEFVIQNYSWDIHNNALEKIIMGGSDEK